MLLMKDYPTGVSVPPKTTGTNVHPELLEERRQTFDQFSHQICKRPDWIFGNPNLSFAFAKFFSPVQIGDVRPPNFKLVFPIDPP